jgi:hypothetical protein
MRFVDPSIPLKSSRNRNYFEGSRQWSNSLPADFTFTPPLVEYGHTNGRNCIIGGLVYHGSRIPQLNGAYIYADYSSGEIWALRHSGMAVTENTLLFKSIKARCNALGIDPSNGDVLFAPASGSGSGTIQRLIYTNKPPVPVITATSLSEGGFSLSGTGGPPNQTYYLKTATNIDVPGTWSPIATGSFDGTGTFSITNPVELNASKSFYRIQVP